MRNRVSTIIFLLLTIVVGPAAAQEDSPEPTMPILNDKAVSLPKPLYPAAARMLSASGIVDVQVTIGRRGRVVSATAINGHDLLRFAAAEAALRARFANSGARGNVTGILRYTFEAPFTPTTIGFELAFAEKTGRFDGFVAPRYVATLIPSDWMDERKTFEQIAYVDPPVPSESPVGDSAAGNAFSDVSRAAKEPGPQQPVLTAESIAKLRQVRLRITERLSPDSLESWSFKLGGLLGQFVAESDNAERTGLNCEEIALVLEEAPLGASRGFVFYIKEFALSCREHLPSDAYRSALAIRASGFKKVNF